MTYQDDLDTYRRGRGYPVTDDALLDLIERRYEGGAFLIVNSKCGLFGQRLIDRQGVTVAGIEPDSDRVTAGQVAGVRMQSHNIELDDRSMIYFTRLLEMYGTTGLIVRDMVNTLHDHVLDWPAFMEIILASNVFELFIEDDDTVAAAKAFEPAFHIVEALSSKLVYLRRDLNVLDTGPA